MAGGYIRSAADDVEQFGMGSLPARVKTGVLMERWDEEGSDMSG